MILAAYSTSHFLLPQNSSFTFLFSGIFNILSIKALHFPFAVSYAPNIMYSFTMKDLLLEEQSKYILSHLSDGDFNSTLYDIIFNNLKYNQISDYPKNIVDDGFYEAMAEIKLGVLVSGVLLFILALFIKYIKFNYSQFFQSEIVSGLCFSIGYTIILYALMINGYNPFNGTVQSKHISILFILFILLALSSGFNLQFIIRIVPIWLYVIGYIICLLFYIFDHSSTNTVINTDWSKHLKVIGYNKDSMKVISCLFKWKVKPFFVILPLSLLSEIDNISNFLPSKVKGTKSISKEKYIQYLIVQGVLTIFSSFFGIAPLTISPFITHLTHSTSITYAPIVIYSIFLIFISLFPAVISFFQHTPLPIIGILLIIAGLNYIKLGITSLFVTHLHSYCERPLCMLLITLSFGVGFGVIRIDSKYPLYISNISFCMIVACFFQLILPHYYDFTGDTDVGLDILNNQNEMNNNNNAFNKRKNSMSMFYRKKKYEQQNQQQQQQQQQQQNQLNQQQKSFVSRYSSIKYKRSKSVVKRRQRAATEYVTQQAVDDTWNMSKELVVPSIIKSKSVYITNSVNASPCNPHAVNKTPDAKSSEKK